MPSPTSPLFAAVLSAAGLFAAVSSLTLLPAAPAHAWWTCASGAELETRTTNPNHVRCVTDTQYKSHDACPNATAMGQSIGTTIRRDYQGNHDKCVGRINGVDVAVLDPSCAGAGSGYTLERRSQPDADRCRKLGSESAPTSNVN